MAFSFPAFSYIIALIVDAFLIFFSIFHVIAFDELKTDYKNPIDQCNSLNPLVLPEYLLHLLINILFLLSGEWFSLLINVPLILYHIHRYYTRPVMSGPGLYDPTSIMNADVLTVCQREGWIKLAFYLLSFFLYLYGTVVLNRWSADHWWSLEAFQMAREAIVISKLDATADMLLALSSTESRSQELVKRMQSQKSN